MPYKNPGKVPGSLEKKIRFLPPHKRLAAMVVDLYISFNSHYKPMLSLVEVRLELVLKNMSWKL